MASVESISMQVFLKALLDMAVKARNLAPRGELGPEG
jgi:hypothetical protein